MEILYRRDPFPGKRNKEDLGPSWWLTQERPNRTGLSSILLRWCVPLHGSATQHINADE